MCTEFYQAILLIPNYSCTSTTITIWTRTLGSQNQKVSGPWSTQESFSAYSYSSLPQVCSGCSAPCSQPSQKSVYIHCLCLEMSILKVLFTGRRRAQGRFPSQWHGFIRTTWWKRARQNYWRIEELGPSLQAWIPCPVSVFLTCSKTA